MANTNKSEDQAPRPVACTPNYDTSDPLQQEITHIITSFKQDIWGILLLGSDGVLRSLTADRKVLSAQAFSPELTEAFLKRLPTDYVAEIQTKFADGRDTPEEKWWRPDKGILPSSLPMEEIQKELSRYSEEDKERLRKRLRENDNLIDSLGIFK